MYNKLLTNKPHKCWCRARKQDKTVAEMFAGIIHPDGIWRGICIECHASGNDMKRWQRIDEKVSDA